MAMEHERVLREVPPVVHRLNTQQAALLHGFGQLQNYVGQWAQAVETCRKDLVEAGLAMGKIRPLFPELKTGVNVRMHLAESVATKCSEQVTKFEKICEAESKYRQQEGIKLS